MPAVTALNAAGRDCVAVDVDGSRWRTLPAIVVARAGLAVGDELDRPRLRLVRNELRRADTLAAAARALAGRDRTASELDARLARRGATVPERAEALATLARTGMLDDARFASARAAALAGRGYGDAAIVADLERRGVAAASVVDALEELEPEAERAARIVRRRGAGTATLRYLERRGFGESAVESVAAAVADDT